MLVYAIALEDIQVCMHFVSWANASAVNLSPEAQFSATVSSLMGIQFYNFIILFHIGELEQQKQGSGRREPPVETRGKAPARGRTPEAEALLRNYTIIFVSFNEFHENHWSCYVLHTTLKT